MASPLAAIVGIGLLFSGALGALAQEAEIVLDAPRTFTSTEGRKMEASVIKIDGANVVIRREGDRNTSTVPMSRFSEADRKWLAAWAKKAAENYTPRLEAKVSRSMKDNFTGVSSGDVRERVALKVFVENREANFDVEGAKARLVTVGVDVTNRNRLKILKVEEFDLRVPAGKTAEFRGDEISYEYDEDEPSVWGEKYYGNALLVKNAIGTTILVKTSQGTLEEHEGVLWGVKEGQFYNRSMELEGGGGKGGGAGKGGSVIIK